MAKWTLVRSWGGYRLAEWWKIWKIVTEGPVFRVSVEWKAKDTNDG